MARVLAISSQVVRGHVGNSAATFALQRMGHEVWVLPTVVLSNHPGHPHVAGTRIDASVLRDMIAALERNGWLGEVDAVLTGYLPTPEHVEVAAETIARLSAHRRRRLVFVDPVLGDDPRGLYVNEDAALAVRSSLMPLADVLSPNRFELSWLTGQSVGDANSAAAAAAQLGTASVAVTSVPGSTSGELLNLLWQPSAQTLVEVPRMSGVPHGTGDLFAALMLGHLLHGQQPREAMTFAVRGVELVIQASIGSDELNLVASQHIWGPQAPPDPRESP